MIIVDLDKLHFPFTTARPEYAQGVQDLHKAILKCKIDAIPIEQLLSILPKYDDYIHTITYPHNETMEDIYSKGHEEGWNACLKAIKEELEDWEEENGRG